jgi:hypothetical protein
VGHPLGMINRCRWWKLFRCNAPVAVDIYRSHHAAWSILKLTPLVISRIPTKRESGQDVANSDMAKPMVAKDPGSRCEGGIQERAKK